MFRAITLIVVFCVSSSASAWAACLPTNPSALPDAIGENGQRIVCIQNELADTTRQRNYEFQLKSLERSLQNLQLQQKFDALPPPLPPVVFPVPVYPQP